MSLSRFFLFLAIFSLAACDKFEQGEKVFVNIPGKSFAADSKASGTVLDMDDGYALVTIDQITGNPRLSKLDFGRDIQEGKSVLIPEGNLHSFIDGEKYWAKREQAANQLKQALENPNLLWRIKDLQISQVEKFVDEYEHTDITNTLSLIHLNRKYFSDLDESKSDDESIELWLENLPGYYTKLQKLIVKTGHAKEFYQATERFKKSFLGMALATNDELKQLDRDISTDPFAALVNGLIGSFADNDSAFVQTAVLQSKNDLKKLEQITYNIDEPDEIAEAYDEYQEAFVAITALLSLDVDGEPADDDELEKIYNKQLFSGLKARIVQLLDFNDGFESIELAEENFENDKELFESLEDEVGIEIFDADIKQRFYLNPTLARMEREERIEEFQELKDSLGKADEALTSYIGLYNNYNNSVDGFPADSFRSRLRKTKSALNAVSRPIRYIDEDNPSKESMVKAKAKMTALVTDLEGLSLLSASYLPIEIYDPAEKQKLYGDSLSKYSAETESGLATKRKSISSHKALISQIAVLSKAEGEMVNVYNKNRNQSGFPARAFNTRLNELRRTQKNISWNASKMNPLEAESELFVKVSGYVKDGVKSVSEANTLLVESIGVELAALSELNKVNDEQERQANVEAMQVHQVLLNDYEHQKQRLTKVDDEYEQLKSEDKFPRKAVSDRIYKVKSALRNVPYNIQRVDPLNQEDKNVETIKIKVAEAKSHMDKIEKLIDTHNQIHGATKSDEQAVPAEAQVNGDDALTSYKHLLDGADTTKERLSELSTLFEKQKGNQGYPVSAVRDRLYKAKSSLRSLDYNIGKADPLDARDNYRQKIRESLISANSEMDEVQKIAEAFGEPLIQSSSSAETSEPQEIPEHKAEAKVVAVESGSSDLSVVHDEPEKVSQASEVSEEELSLSTTEQQVTPSQDSQIVSLLKIADTQFKANRLTSPKGDCAVESYKAVLELEPNHQAAIEGLNKVAEKYAGWGNSALNRGETKKAQSYLVKAKMVMATNAKVQELEKAMITELAKQPKVSEPRPQAEVKTVNAESPVESEEEPSESEIADASTSEEPLSGGEQFKKDLNTLKDTIGGAFGKLFN